MATTPINNVIRGGAQGRSVFPSALPVLSSSVSYNQGDLLCFDTSNHVLITAVTGNSANLLGVAINTVVNGVPKSPYQGTAVDASEGASDMGGPLFNVVATFFLDTGAGAYPGQLMYISNVGPQNVTSVSAGGMLPMGIYSGSQGTIVSAASGSRIDVLVGETYTQAALNF